MQLDKTRIAIRQRGVLDILDVSLHMLWIYGRPIGATFILGAAAFALLNHALIGWMADVEYAEETPWRYLWYMSVLVYVEAPLAAAFCTAYLGRVVFEQSCRSGEIMSDVLGMWGHLLWGFVVLRGIGLVWLLVLSVEHTEDPAYGVLALLFFLMLLVFGLRASRPYLGEVILLERNPLLRSRSGGMTIGARSQMLHNPNSSELIGRGLGGALICTLFLLAIVATCSFVSGVFFGAWDFGPILVQIFIPASMWGMAMFFCVVRYLSYLDLRIRQEGWEVELLVRAEANRLQTRNIG